MTLAIIMIIGCILWWIYTTFKILLTSDENWASFSLSMICGVITLIEAVVKYN